MDILMYIVVCLVVLFLFIYKIRKICRYLIYLKYKKSQNFNSREEVFYFNLKKALPKGCHVLGKVKVKDIIKLVKAKKQNECVELLDKSKQFKNIEFDYIVIDKKYKFICAINISEEKENLNVPTLFDKDDKVILFLKQLNLKVLNYTFADRYDLRTLYYDIMGK